MADDLAGAIRASAERLGISPYDLATAISYETAGTFDPWKAGPTTKWGQHRGLIQWGEPQRRKYGVTADMPVADQLVATERYLTDAGVKPGMGLLDVYSAINAGRVGLYNRSDAHAGGAPGTVADKVANQMHGHRLKAAMLLDGKLPDGVVMPRRASAPAPGASSAVAAAAPAASRALPLSIAPPVDPSGAVVGGADPALALLGQIAKNAEDDRIKPVPMMPIQYANPPGLQRARALARAMGMREV